MTLAALGTVISVFFIGRACAACPLRKRRLWSRVFPFCGALEELLQFRLFPKTLLLMVRFRLFSASPQARQGLHRALSKPPAPRLFDDLPPTLSPRPLQPSVRRVSRRGFFMHLPGHRPRGGGLFFLFLGAGCPPSAFYLPSSLFSLTAAPGRPDRGFHRNGPARRDRPPPGPLRAFARTA